MTRKAAVGLAIAGLLTAGGAAQAASAPPGYTIARQDGFVAHANGQTRGSVTCPPGTVPLSGGAAIFTPSLDNNVNSSFPSGSTWIVDVNDAGPADVQFNVFAVCAAPPRRYAVVETPPTANPSGLQSGGSATCPGRSKPVGGGLLSQSLSTAVNINSTSPAGRSWHVDVGNGSGEDTTFEAFAVCAKLPLYAVAVGAPVLNPPGAQTFANVGCPPLTVPVGGGVSSSSADTLVDLNSTFPNGTAWASFENDRTPFPFQITPFAVCAA
jgi:hypothetical protein